MPFQKGRQKTGGRTKTVEVTGRKSSRLVDRLLDHGFDFHKEFARALKGLPDGSGPTGTKFAELKALLPYMAPKLKEKEVESIEPTEPAVTESAITTDDLLKAFSNDTETKTDKRASSPNPLEKRSVELHAQASSKIDLPDLAGVEEEE